MNITSKSPGLSPVSSNINNITTFNNSEALARADSTQNLNALSGIQSPGTSVTPSTVIPPAPVGPPHSLTTASSSSLVDFFCAASERPFGEDLDLDLMSLLLNESSEIEQKRRAKHYYRRSGQIKLERENVLSFNTVPIDVNEAYTFNLTDNTKHLNIFLWSTQYLHKMTKVKSILIGYISMPLYEINVDCWNTIQGETQSTIHFSPLDELKASAISKLSHSHVISDHPGFDSCLSVGSITLKFKHVLPSSADQDSFSSVDDEKKEVIVV